MKPDGHNNAVSFFTSRRQIVVGERTLIMGVINTTPDSFSGDGLYGCPEEAIDEGIKMAEEGADILDIGGESSRPGSDPVSLKEELKRVIPVVRGLSSKISLPISVDTVKARVAREALDAGAEIINDINALRYNLAMAKTIADYGAAVVLMHIRGKPKIMQKGDLSYHCVPGDMIAFLRERMETAESEGINANRIIIDPGIGFGKTPTDNMRMIRYLEDFNTLERPILVGVSRKSFIGHVVGGTPKERMEGTAAAVTAAVLNGAHIIRVHDVPFMKKVILMADAIRRA
jgi:dihydropteroate synthase